MSVLQNEKLKFLCSPFIIYYASHKHTWGKTNFKLPFFVQKEVLGFGFVFLFQKKVVLQTKQV